MAGVKIKFPENYEEFQYPVGFSIKVHPTLKSPNPAMVPRYMMYQIKCLNRSNVEEILRAITVSDGSEREYRSPILNLVYAIFIRDIAWDHILTPNDLDFLEHLDYNIGTMYLHLDVSIVYSDTQYNSDWFTKDRVMSDFENYTKDKICLNTSTGVYYGESRYLECRAVNLIACLYKRGSRTYEVSEHWIDIPDHFYQYLLLNNIGFIKTFGVNRATRATVVKRNSIVVFQ